MCFAPLLWKMLWTQTKGWARRFTNDCLWGKPDEVDRSYCGYSEIVLNGQHYKTKLPSAVEAFFYPVGDDFIHHREGDETSGRTAWQKFRRSMCMVEIRATVKFLSSSTTLPRSGNRKGEVPIRADRSAASANVPGAARSRPCVVLRPQSARTRLHDRSGKMHRMMRRPGTSPILVRASAGAAVIPDGRWIF